MPDTGKFDFTPFDVLTFDCYGTLIDWETGILTALRRVVGDAGTDDQLLEAYARAEARLEAGAWQPYRQILATALTEVAQQHGATVSADKRQAFGSSVTDWQPFADSVDALASLKARYRLGVITNCDDDLFAASNRMLGEPFSWVVTAEQVGSYKPDSRNFDVGLERIGVPRDRVLHVAQSLYHDHVPARAAGLTTAWIDRRHETPGFGATPPANATPDVVAPDMATFATMALA